MNQNHRRLSPDCAAFAPLLPLASHNLLSEEKASALNAHLAACASCRAELSTYDQAERVLRHVFSQRQQAMSLLSREEIQQTLLNSRLAGAASSPGLVPQPTALPEPPRRKHRFFAGIPAFAATLVIVLMATVIFGIAGHLPGLRGSGATRIALTKTVPPTGVDLTRFVLNSISMVSADEGWAVGVARLPAGISTATSVISRQYGDPVILHYSQGHWKSYPLNINRQIGCSASGGACPAISLNSIAMVSATDGWIVGNTMLPLTADGITTGVVLHYTRNQWVFDRLLGSRLSKVFMRTASDGWMVGEGNSGWSGNNGSTSVFHYNGSAWTPMNAPAFASFQPQTIVALSATNVWLAGTDYSGSGFDGDAPEVILHYDGSRWSQQNTDLANSRIYGMAMVSPGVGWAVGSLAGGTGPHPARPQKALVEQYSPGKWQQATSFSGPSSAASFSLYGIAMVSAQEGWAVGSNGLIVHAFNGTWTQVFSPTSQTLKSIAMLSPTEGWAVGDQGTILHYFNNAWHLYQG